MSGRRVDGTALTAGIVFIVLGLAFLAERLGIVDVSARFVVPVLLVALGAAMLFGRSDAGPDRPAVPPPPPQQPPAPGPAEHAAPGEPAEAPDEPEETQPKLPPPGDT